MPRLISSSSSRTGTATPPLDEAQADGAQADGMLCSSAGSRGHALQQCRMSLSRFGTDRQLRLRERCRPSPNRHACLPLLLHLLAVDVRLRHHLHRLFVLFRHRTDRSARRARSLRTLFEPPWRGRPARRTRSVRARFEPPWRTRPAPRARSRRTLFGPPWAGSWAHLEGRSSPMLCSSRGKRLLGKCSEDIKMVLRIVSVSVLRVRERHGWRSVGCVFDFSYLTKTA